jgi:NDP-sugar pyrophosphorylase family protein
MARDAEASHLAADLAGVKAAREVRGPPHTTHGASRNTARYVRERAVQAVVLAGGLATRMRPRTLKVPKSMLEVGGRPFVDWQLTRLVESGFDEVVMCIAHLGDQIRAHVGDGAHLGIKVSWAEEGPSLLGTAGALRGALPLLAEEFLVTYGDSYLPFDYGEPLRLLAAHDDCDGVMAIFKNEGRWDVSNVKTDGAWVARYEKGGGLSDPSFDHIDYGAIALRRSVISPLPVGQRAGLDALQGRLAGEKRLRACVAHARFFEIGSPEGLAELDGYLRSKGSP